MLLVELFFLIICASYTTCSEYSFQALITPNLSVLDHWEILIIFVYHVSYSLCIFLTVSIFILFIKTFLRLFEAHSRHDCNVNSVLNFIEFDKFVS